MDSAVNSSMLRIGYIFERFPSFGQTFCYREVVELKRQGAEVSVFSIRTPAGEPRQDWDEQVVRNVHYLPDEAELVKEVNDAIRQRDLPAEAVSAISKWDRQSDFLRLYQAAYVGSRLREAGITRVHAHFAGMAARTAYWIKRFFGIDYSLTAHANDIFAPRNFVVSLSKIVDSAAAVVTVSDFAAARLQEQFPENARKIHRVYNGVDLRAVDPPQFSGDPPLIVSVGRLIEKKGFGDLIRACALLKSHGLRFRCEIIGEGPLDAALSAHIRDLQLTNCVELLGPRTQGEIAQRFRAATMFVLACTTEADGGMDNLPTVIMEAMAAGLPVISTPLAGVPEMVEHGASGELVPQRNPVALASAIERLLADPGAAARFGARGREVAAQKFSIEANVWRLAQVLDGC